MSIHPMTKVTGVLDLRIKIYKEKHGPWIPSTSRASRSPICDYSIPSVSASGSIAFRIIPVNAPTARPDKLTVTLPS